MIHEYAIDPELVVAWGKDRADYRYFYEKFGLGTPRVIADFPLKKWKKQFWKAYETADDNEKMLIIELYKRIKEPRIRRLSQDYDANRTWLENAEKENERHHFQAILSKDNPRDHDQVLSTRALGDLPNDHPLWYVKSQASCARQAREMADLLSPLLTNCYELHFVDPYFTPKEPRFRKPLAEFLKKVVHLRHRRPPIKKIVMHMALNPKKPFPKEDFSFCEQRLPGLIPKGLPFEVKLWQQKSGGEKLHNRYILTDIGGVKIDPGLDDGKDGESFEVILLEREPYEKQLDNYLRSPAFDLAEQVTVIGTV